MIASQSLQSLQSKASSVSASPDLTSADRSHSNTSISSIDEDAGDAKSLDLKSLDSKLISEEGMRKRGAIAEGTKNKNGVLLDTYGNEFEIPDININDIRNAIPKHCFVRSAPRSLGYVARDFLQLAANWYLFRFVLTPRIDSPIINGFLWFTFTVVQGFIMTGLWVLAHECGHQAFSDYKILNDTVGWVLHSALGVPYFSWKISHGKHHKATGHLERDQVFVPATREIYASKLGKVVHEVTELGEETPLVTSLSLLAQQAMGWNMYISTNVTGHNKHENAPGGRGAGKKNGIGGGVNHFDPNSPIFDEKDRHLIILSDIGLLLAVAGLTFVGMHFGKFVLIVGYVIPYLWVNNWLVWITYLQHTDPTLPHYSPSSWNFTRGAAATIDREFGFIGRYFMHGIVETHVLHHFISTIPFYNADEASDAIRPVLGKHYRSNTEGGPIGFLKSMWTSTRLCRWVEPSEGAQGEGLGVMFFRNNNKSCTPAIKMRGPLAAAS